MKVPAWVSGVAAAVVSLSVVSAACAAPPKNVLAEAARAAPDGRTVQVLVAQGEIKSDINQSTVVVATGGGLLGALIDAKINSDRAKKAEVEIQPLRAALTGYDADALAIETTRTALSKVSWFQPAGASAFGRDSSLAGKSGTLDASPTAQVAFVEYAYDAAPDFSSLRVGVSVQLANKAAIEGKAPQVRLYPKHLAYAQNVVCIVRLPSPSNEATENVARWSANDGKLARKALAMAFEDAGAMIPRVLEQSEADLKVMKARQKADKVKIAADGGRAGGEDGAEGTVTPLGFITRVHTLSE